MITAETIFTDYVLDGPHRYYDKAVDMPRAEAERLLNAPDAEFRLTTETRQWEDHPPVEDTTLEIKHEGVWKPLLRTDLMDDVCTGHCCSWSQEKWLAHWRAEVKGCYGARVSATRFALIDSLSDG